MQMAIEVIVCQKTKVGTRVVPAPSIAENSVYVIIKVHHLVPNDYLNLSATYDVVVVYGD